MASVRKRKSPDGVAEKDRWVVDYVDQAGTRRLKTFAKKKDADAFKQKTEREIFEGIHTAAGESITFAKLADLYLDDCERRKRLKDRMSGNTFDLARRLTNKHLRPHFGSKIVTDITAASIRDFVNEKAETYGRVMVVKLVVALRTILQMGVELTYLKRNVVRDQPPRIPLPPRKQVEIPNLEALKRLVALVELRTKQHRSRHVSPLITAAVVYLALTTGLRKGEICGLLWENVDLDDAIIRVRHSMSRFDGLKGPKTEAGIRDIPMPAILQEKLTLLHSFEGAPSTGPVFRTRYGKAIMPNDLTEHYWTPLAKEAGLYRESGRIIGLHLLRHAAASLWIRSELPVLAVKKAIGHSSISTTLDVYGHLFPEDHATRSAVLNAASDLLPRPQKTIDATYTRHEEPTH